jgi:hypothetical protein
MIKEAATHVFQKYTRHHLTLNFDTYKESSGSSNSAFGEIMIMPNYLV